MGKNVVKDRGGKGVGGRIVGEGRETTTKKVYKAWRHMRNVEGM